MARNSNTRPADLSVQVADTEAEELLLGTLLVNRDAIRLVAWLTPADFYSDRHRWIWQAIVNRHEDPAYDFLLVQDELKRMGKIGPDLIELDYITDLTQRPPTYNHAESYARRIRQARREEEFRRATEKAITLVASSNGADSVVRIKEHLATIDEIFPDPATATPPTVNGNGYHAREAFTLARDLEEDQAPTPNALVPDLPSAARLPDALGNDVGEWLDDYCRYASLVSERTPAIVHEAAGLWLVSVAIARRLYVSLPHGDVYPNLYVLAVAPTTLYAKTTGLAVMTGLLDEALPHLTLSNESTPEALLSELAGKEPPNLDAAEITDKDREVWRLGQRFAAQRGLVLEEASSLLAGMKKDYMQGTAELLLRLYDNPSSYRRHTRGGGYLVIRRAYTSIVGWTTPARLRTAETNTAWHDGLFARFALLTPDGPPTRPSEEVGKRPSRPTRLVEDLTRLGNVLLPAPERFPDPVIGRPVAIDEEAARAWRRYYTACSFDLLTAKGAPDGRLHGTYGRLPAMALKVATLLAVLDWAAVGKDDLVITLGHYAAAQRITERWRASSHRLLDLLTTRYEAEEEASDLERVLTVIERTGKGWLTVRDLVRKLDSSRYTTGQVQSLIRALAEDGRIEVQERRPEGAKGGRPSLVVRCCPRS